MQIIVHKGTRHDRIRNRLINIDGYLRKELRGDKSQAGKVSDFKQWSTSKSKVGDSKNGMIFKEKNDIVNDYRKKGFEV